MTAKEKAHELVDMFREREINGIWEIKKCALICVDEKIKSLDRWKYSISGVREIEFLDRVKIQIDKL